MGGGAGQGPTRRSAGAARGLDGDGARADPLVAAFAESRRRASGRLVVIEGSRSLDAEGLSALSGRLGEELASVEPGRLLGLAAPNGPGFLAGLLAARSRGLGVLLLDAATPGARQAQACRSLGAAAILRVRAWPEGPGDWRLEAVAPVAPVTPAPAPAGLEIVKLSSGTTGRPAGLELASAALLADEAALHAVMGLRDDERTLGAIPWSHSYGLSSVAVPALVRRGTIVLPGGRPGPFTLLEACREREVSFLPTSPAWLAGLERLEGAPRLAPGPRLVVSAGAPLPAEVARRFRERHGLVVHAFYGASECGGICFDRDGGASERGTVGAPVEGVSIELESPDAGGRGRVLVRSPALARRVLPEDDGRLAGAAFRSSDLAEWRDGELRLHGRLDRLLLVDGRKVDPSEVEAAVQGLPGLREAVALELPRPGGAGAVVALAVEADPARVDAARVRERCRERLPAHARPRRVVVVEALPRNPRGKPDRDAIRELLV